jgi:hypothetical protein
MPHVSVPRWRVTAAGGHLRVQIVNLLRRLSKEHGNPRLTNALIDDFRRADDERREASLWVLHARLPR